MNEAHTINSRLVLIYTDGSHEEFEFPPQFERTKRVSILQKLLESAVLCMQVGDRLVFIPTANIRSAELFPAPQNLPEMVMRDVKRIH